MTSRGIVGVAVGFLVVDGVRSAAASGRRCSGPSQRHSRSAGTLVALALAFTLFFAELADAAQARADHRRVRRRALA